MEKNSLEKGDVTGPRHFLSNIPMLRAYVSLPPWKRVMLPEMCHPFQWDNSSKGAQPVSIVEPFLF